MTQYTLFEQCSSTSFAHLEGDPTRSTTPSIPPKKKNKKRKKYYNKYLKKMLMDRLQQDADFLAKAFHLKPFQLFPERANVRNRYGVCYSDGVIKIRLNDLRSGKPLRYSSLIDTLCHELAHLRYMNHGERFQRLYKRILEHARKHGIYRPYLPPRQGFLPIGTQATPFKPQKSRRPNIGS